MDQVWQQIPTLAGVAIGALASYLTSSANERSKWRRDRDLRRSEKQSLAYAEYGSAVKETYQWTMHFAHCRGLPAFGPDMTLEEVSAEMSRVSMIRAVKWETVLLLGSEATISAARRWHESIWQMQHVASSDGLDLDEWMAAREESNDARTAFYDSARADLGVSGETVRRRRRP
ncbi:hypothetical protein GCM10010172_72040 [Paractinoplanes ferrugineus]|uniref:Secreted protein n=1 Tax=Paractinoplanes ferrugineus TaxID=113564 RepID=A0A919J7D3_9ACTN|nr:hypothetical protein [Actinoplanes ferrugineus]GIE15413.1 hypothetical protein Afe05nite_72530 [Actinoplanes ferrugineus]